ncbi:MAG: cytidylate kinase-like family protein [Clostridia bacterium]|nr:cytidylate kinase-like family protein [Clostridia bacterium]
MNKKFIITIARQFGSGGSEIGYRLAQELGIQYYDKELVTQAAKESGMCEHVMAQEEEKTAGSFLYSMVLSPHAAAAQFLNWTEDSLNDRIYKAQASFIRKTAAETSCVFIGRCADYLLWDEPNVLRIFIQAEMEDRKARIAARGDLSPEQAADVIKKKDKIRGNYYNFHTGNRWNNLENYDLCVNVSKIGGVDNAVQLIKEAIALRLKD